MLFVHVKRFSKKMPKIYLFNTQ